MKMSVRRISDIQYTSYPNQSNNNKISLQPTPIFYSGKEARIELVKEINNHLSRLDENEDISGSFLEEIIVYEYKL